MNLLIDYKDLKDIKIYKSQGLSSSRIFSAIYNNQRVIVKAQKKGSLQSTNSDDRFLQELEVLKLKIPGVVNLIGYGDNFNGERFLVLEELFPLKDEINVQKISNEILLTARQLYLHKFNWTATLKHVMVDKNNNVKLIDFNDINHKRESFLDSQPQHDVIDVIKDLCKKYNADFNLIKEKSLRYLIEKEYQSLENVHDPIYFNIYSDIPKRITEPGKNHNKIVPANRTCFDRGELIKKVLKNDSNKGLTCLDIGSNTGWFTFFIQDLGFTTTGVDFDINHWGSDRPPGWPKDSGGKIEFCRLLEFMFNNNAKFDNADVNLLYVKSIPKYDVILTLSILHLYFIQHKVSKKYWMDLFINICKKINKFFIFEVPEYILPHLKLSSFNELLTFTKTHGNFSKVYIVGKSTEGRPLIVCEK